MCPVQLHGMDGVFRCECTSGMLIVQVSGRRAEYSVNHINAPLHIMGSAYFEWTHLLLH